MSPSLDRRTLMGALAAALTTAGASGQAADLGAILDPEGGPPMACAGLIARRGDGSVAMRVAAGSAGGGPRRPRQPPPGGAVPQRGGAPAPLSPAPTPRPPPPRAPPPPALSPPPPP